MASTHGTLDGAHQLHPDGRLCVRCQTATDRHQAILSAQQSAAPVHRRPRKGDEHGTPAGYAAHARRRKTDPTHTACQPCKDAAAADTQARKINRSNPGAPHLSWHQVLAARNLPTPDPTSPDPTHQLATHLTTRHCQATRRDGTPCQARGYPYCGHHQAATPSDPTLTTLIDTLDRAITTLTALRARLTQTPTPRRTR